MVQALTERKEWKFFTVLPKADPGLAVVWWTALLLQGVLMAKGGQYSELYGIQAAAYR